MPIIEEVTGRNQHGQGKFKARANPDNFRTHWGVVSGDNVPPGYESLSELVNTGVPIGHRSGRLKFEEFEQGGKTNDIKIGGMTLRECVVPIKDAKEKERREALESAENADYTKFTTREGINREQFGGQLSMRGEVTSELYRPPAPSSGGGIDPILQSPVHSGFGTEAHQVPYQPALQAEPPKKTVVSGWTPERRARQMATIAAKKSQPQ